MKQTKTRKRINWVKECFILNDKILSNQIKEKTFATRSVHRATGDLPEWCGGAQTFTHTLIILTFQEREVCTQVAQGYRWLT